MPLHDTLDRGTLRSIIRTAKITVEDSSRCYRSRSWRKRKGIEPSGPPSREAPIGFEGRDRHQSGTRFRTRG